MGIIRRWFSQHSAFVMLNNSSWCVFTVSGGDFPFLDNSPNYLVSNLSTSLVVYSRKNGTLGAKRDRIKPRGKDYKIVRISIEPSAILYQLHRIPSLYVISSMESKESTVHAERVADTMRVEDNIHHPVGWFSWRLLVHRMISSALFRSSS